MPVPLESLLALLYQHLVNQVEDDLLTDELLQVGRASSVPINRVRQLFSELKLLVSNAVRRKASISDFFDSCNFLADESDKQILQSWFDKHREILSSSIESQGSDTSIIAAPIGVAGLSRAVLSEVVDVDWRLLVSVASSESDRLASTHVQVRLSISDPEKGSTAVRHVPFEVSVAQFYGLMHELRKMKAALDAVTA